MRIAEFHNPKIQAGGGTDTFNWKLSYDQLNRLTGANYDSTSSSTSMFDVSGLAYDAAGNIDFLKRHDETGSLIDNMEYLYYPNSNRLKEVKDPSGQQFDWDAASVANFSYDNNGNLISQLGKLSNVAYDHRNLPTRFILSAGDTLIANYNAGGQRILKELKGGAWQFYVKDGQQTLAVIDETGLSHINLVGNSTFGRWESGGARRYYITDHLGSTRAVVDDQGTVLETFDYYPFGLLMPQRSSTTGNTIEKFTGKERDEAIGLDYFGARYYDPAINRWIGVDPLARERPSLSPYNYVRNNPLLRVDPDGKLDDYYINQDGSSFVVRNDDDNRYFVETSNTGTNSEGVGVGRYESVELNSAEGRRALDNTPGLAHDIAFNKESNASNTDRGTAFGSIVRQRSNEALATTGKYTALGTGLAGAMLTGGGFLAGSTKLVLAGSSVSTVGSSISAGESVSKGNEGAAALKVTTGLLSRGGYGLVGQLTNNTEKLTLSYFIFLQEGIANTAINAAEVKEEREQE